MNSSNLITSQINDDDLIQVQIQKIKLLISKRSQYKSSARRDCRNSIYIVLPKKCMIIFIRCHLHVGFVPFATFVGFVARLVACED